MITFEQIDEAKTPRGSWTRMQLEAWDVPYPPRRGWRHKLVEDSRAWPADRTWSIGEQLAFVWD